MDVTDAHSFRLIDREVDDHSFSPAQYEIVRRVIHATADFEYQSLIQFSGQALAAGAAALTEGQPLVVDVPMLQVAIVPSLQRTFSNAVHCSIDKNLTQKGSKTKVILGFETLARQYPDGIFIVGQNFKALLALIKLVEAREINPALVIGTPPLFLHAHTLTDRLERLTVPRIYVAGRKGSSVVAAAIINGLVNLSWQTHVVQLEAAP